MWNSGIIQGLMWRTYNDSGTLAYSFIESLVAMHPYYVARTIGGLLFLIGAIVAAYNIWMTIRDARRAHRRGGGESGPAGAIPGRGRNASRPESEAGMREIFHRKLERSAIGFVLAIIGVSAIGGFVEIAPLFTIDETVETAPDMRVYTPLELAGRNIYIARRLLRLSFPDDPHAARRGGALRPLLAGGRIPIRSSDAVGLEAHRAGPRPRSAANILMPGTSRIWSIRATWCRNR